MSLESRTLCSIGSFRDEKAFPAASREREIACRAMLSFAKCSFGTRSGQHRTTRAALVGRPVPDSRGGVRSSPASHHHEDPGGVRSNIRRRHSSNWQCLILRRPISAKQIYHALVRAGPTSGPWVPAPRLFGGFLNASRYTGAVLGAGCRPPPRRSANGAFVQKPSVLLPSCRPHSTASNNSCSHPINPAPRVSSHSHSTTSA